MRMQDVCTHYGVDLQQVHRHVLVLELELQLVVCMGKCVMCASVCLFRMSIYFSAKVMSKFVYLRQNFSSNSRCVFDFREKCGKLICFKRNGFEEIEIFRIFFFPFLLLVVKCHEPINQCDSQININ